MSLLRAAPARTLQERLATTAFGPNSAPQL